MCACKFLHTLVQNSPPSKSENINSRIPFTKIAGTTKYTHKSSKINKIVYLTTNSKTIYWGRLPPHLETFTLKNKFKAISKHI